MSSKEVFLQEFADYCRQLESPERRREDASLVMDFIQTILDDSFLGKLPVRPINTQSERNLHQNTTESVKCKEPTAERSELHISEKDEKICLEDAIDIFRRKVLARRISALNGAYFGVVHPPTCFIAQLAESLGTFLFLLNATNTMTPGGCDLELHVLTWLCSIIGYGEESCGYLTSSSTNATVHGFMVARDERLNSDKPYDRYVVYMSELAHRANWMSLRVVGLGRCQIRKIPIDNSFKLNAVMLEETIQGDIKAGYTPFMVVGTAGTTDAGSIDPLPEMACIAKKYDLWFHVDAAIGGVCMISENMKHLMRGIENTDSVALSLQKLFFQPNAASAILLRDGQKLKACMSTTNPNFLEVNETTKYSPIDYTFETSRPLRGLSLWFCVKIFGKTFFQKIVEEKLYLSQYLQEKLTQIPFVTVYTEPELPIVLYRYEPPNQDTEQTNVKLAKLLATETKLFIHHVVICGITYQRACITGQRTHIQEVNTLFETIREKIELLHKEKN